MRLTVDALWICTPHLMPTRERHHKVYIHILREASARLPVPTLPGNTRASDSGTSNRIGSHASVFSVLYSNCQHRESAGRVKNYSL